MTAPIALTLADIAAEIDAAHADAVRHADSAIEHARRAGALLHTVKSQLPHGQWLHWLQTNCTVSLRQAQRYIRAHHGLPLSPRAICSPLGSPRKCDAVSHLPRREAAFEPVPDCWMLAKHDGRMFCVEQSATPGYFFASMMMLLGDDADAEVAYLLKPIRGDYIELPLRGMGLPAASAVPWHIGRGCRVDAALAGGAE